MINTGPNRKMQTAAGMAGAPIGGMAQANAPLGARAPSRRPPMTPHGMAGQAVGAVKSWFGGGKKPPMGASGAGIGPSPMMQPGFKSVNATGATGNPMSQFGSPSGPPPDIGPVANTAPPMFQPPSPMDMGGSDMGMGGGNPMLMDQYMKNNTGVMGPRRYQSY